MRPAESKPWRANWWIGVQVVAPLVVFIEGVFRRKLLAPGEAFTYNLPLHTLVGRMWRHGWLPAWNTWSFSGSPLLALGQPGAFYPPDLLFAVLSPVAANNATVILSFMVSGLGGYMLGRHLTGDPVAGVVTGLAFAFSGFFFAHLPHQSLSDSAGWMPWMLYGFERLREQITPRRVLVAGISVALAFLAGHFQLVAIGLAVLLAYAVLVFVLDDGPIRTRRNTALAAVLTAGVGLGLSAIQWVSTAAILGSTQRSKLPFAVATTYSLRPSHLPLLAFPYLFGGGAGMGPYSAGYHGLWNLTEISGYPGLFAGVLAVVGVVAARRDRRVWALLAVAAIGLLASMGSATPLGTLIYHLPLYGQFRSWGRFVVVVDLVVAILAGFGVAALRRASAAEEAEQRRLMITAGAAAGAVVFAALVVAYLPRVSHYVPGSGGGILLARLLPALAAVAAAGVVVLFVKAPKVAVPLCCALVLLDSVGTFGWTIVWRSNLVPPPASADLATSPNTAPTWGPVLDVANGIDRYVLAGPDPTAVSSFPQLNAVQQIRSVNGFDPLAPSDYAAATGDQQYYGGVLKPQDFWAPNSSLTDLLRVTTLIVQKDPAQPKPPANSMWGTASVSPDGRLLRYERPADAAAPDAFLVSRVRKVTHQQAVAAVDGSAGPFADRSEAVVDTTCSACGPLITPPAPTSSTAQDHDRAVRTSGANTIRVDATASVPSLLVVSEAWFPGWQVTVDGHSASAVRADGVLLGVVVPAGHHIVHFHYRPPGIRLGALISILTLLGLLGYAIVDEIWIRRARG